MEMEGNETITITRRHRSADFAMPEDHYHPQYELFYLASGRCRIFLNHTIYHMKPGDFLLIEPMALHHTSYGIAQDNERYAVYFEEPYLDRLRELCGTEWEKTLRDHLLIRLDTGRRRYLEHMLQKMIAEKRRNDGFSEMLIQNDLYELLSFFVRYVEEEQELPFPEPGESMDREDAIQEAAGYIYTHYPETLTLETVADRVHMSPAYFSRKFKKITGLGYKEYVNYVRIRQACRMLRETDLSVMEIAQHCGYSDSNYFGDLFKKEKGMSPRMYRQHSRLTVGRRDDGRADGDRHSGSLDR